MTDTIFFDLDGTLVDSVPGVQYAIKKAWVAIYPGIPCEDIRKLMGPPVREMFRRLIPTADELQLNQLENGFRLAYDSDGWLMTTPYPGVIPALQTLRAANVRCLGVTNKPSRPTQRILSHCGLAGFFQAFFSIDSRQPPFTSKAEAVRTLAAQYEIDLAEAVLVGDTVEDARTARDCGVSFIAFQGGYGWDNLVTTGDTAQTLVDFGELARLLHKTSSTG
jgi:phosphoglycolate phosphatase